MNELFTRIETEMMNRRFLAANSVLRNVENGALGADGIGRALAQYCRLPEEIVKILLGAAGHFPRKSPVHRELARNVAQEKGYGTGGVAHVDILKHMLLRDLNVDAHNVTGSPATEAFIAALHTGMQRNASYALGQAFALEASAVPELGIVVGPLVNAAARCMGLEAPISPEALTEGGAYELKTIRTRSQALAMTADHWFAMHVKDFEVGHRDHLRHYAISFLLRDGDEGEFEAGFLQVMDLMDAWWDSLASSEAFVLEDHGTIEVDYAKTVDELLLTWNCDGEMNENITSVNFPNMRKGIVTVTMRFLTFVRDTPDEEVNAWCETHRHRRASALEMLTLVTKRPELRWDGSLLAGQILVFRGTRLLALAFDPVPAGFGRIHRRSARLSWVKKPWRPTYRHLVIPL